VSDMRGQTLFLYPPKEDSRVLNEVLLPAGAAPARVEEVQLTEAIVELVRAGLGVSVIARWAVEPVIGSGTLVARPLTARGLRRQWSAVMPKDLANADFVREFVDLLMRNAPGQSRRSAAPGSARVAHIAGG
jgi:LysR family transcriptional regulator, regulator for metE and metH